MTEFANKIKTELVTRKIITNKLEVKKISGESHCFGREGKGVFGKEKL